MGTHTRILKKYNRRCSKRYSKKSKRHTRKNIYSKTYKKIQKGGFFCKKEKDDLETAKKELQIANMKLKDAEIELKKAKAELDEVMVYNKTLDADIKGLKHERFLLRSDLDKLNVKLNQQTSPTDEEIAAVTLDENDMKKIENELNLRAARYNTSGFTNSNPNEERENYIKNNIESAIIEYKKEKLMKEKLMKNPTA